MNSTVIRDAMPHEASTIRGIALDTWWITYGPIISADQIRYMLEAIYNETLLHDQMATREQHFILLLENDVPSGFAAYSPQTEDPSAWKLHKLYVLPSGHGRGFGRQLVNEILRRSAQQGISALELNVNRDNPARHFYERIGFQIVRQEDIAIGPYWMNDYVMRLVIGGRTIA
jgi:ribosomal protein S18 acetylase RimI-like enzyme